MAISGETFGEFGDTEGAADRTVAIVAVAFLDAAIEELLTSTMVPNKDERKRLFKSTGPLGAFENKARLAFLLKMINDKVLNDLVLFGSIRNRFGHKPECDSFSDQAIKSWLKKTLVYPVARKFIEENDRKRKKANRDGLLTVSYGEVVIFLPGSPGGKLVAGDVRGAFILSTNFLLAALKKKPSA